MSWFKKAEKPFWAVLPAKNGNCHKSINIAQGTLIFGSSTKWVSRVIWPFQKIFCLLFKILRYRQILVKTSGSPQTIFDPKICPFLSWSLFLMQKRSSTAISEMGFWIIWQKFKFYVFGRFGKIFDLLGRFWHNFDHLWWLQDC